MQLVLAEPPVALLRVAHWTNQSYARIRKDFIESLTSTWRRGNTRSTTERKFCCVIRSDVEPPQAHVATYLGARTPSKTLSRAPTTAPAASGMPMAGWPTYPHEPTGARRP